jgi:hypothetical protein
MRIYLCSVHVAIWQLPHTVWRPKVGFMTRQRSHHGLLKSRLVSPLTYLEGLKNNVKLSGYSVSGSRFKPGAFPVRRIVSHPNAMLGFGVQTDLWKASTLKSCKILVIRSVNDRIGYEAALVPPRRSTVPEGGEEIKYSLYA